MAERDPGSTWRVLRQTAIGAFTEYMAFYTWKTWLVGWLGRLLMQVSFFALVGRLLGSPEQVEYLVVGNAVYLVAMEACIVILATVGERRSGTLPLMVAAPATHVTVYLGRGVHYLTSGLVTSTVALLVLPLVFGVDLRWPQLLLALPMLVVIGTACYAYGLALSCIVLARPGWRWTAMNVSYLVLLAFAGVNVPVGTWPAALQALSQVLPLTHGLAAVRVLLDGGPAGAVLGQLALEALVGAAWFAVAAGGFTHAVRVGRAQGTLELAA